DQVWPDYESFKRDLDAYLVHWNTRRRQVKLKGLTPEEFRNQSLGLVAEWASIIVVQVLGRSSNSCGGFGISVR
ncbi:MAG: IS3 family transposase, partial [Atopobiaceae bacterium]|nr:IS3 family transposase [Atopobiaceae bacterium]